MCFQVQRGCKPSGIAYRSGLQQQRRCSKSFSSRDIKPPSPYSQYFVSNTSLTRQAQAKPIHRSLIKVTDTIIRTGQVAYRQCSNRLGRQVEQIRCLCTITAPMQYSLATKFCPRAAKKRAEESHFSMYLALGHAS